MPETLLFIVSIQQSVMLLALGIYIWIRIKPKKTRKKKAGLQDREVYDILDTLLNHCKACKDKEGSMLITAYGKRLYDSKVHG